MFFLSDMLNKKLKLPKPGEALPGREQPIPTASKHFVSGAAAEGPYPEGLETAMFGLGCFWGAERLFWQTDGVWVTAVGYAGGSRPNPTYQETCTGLTGHAEVVLVVFDPNIVSYADLLKIFWESHDPTQGMRQGNDVGTPTARRSTPSARRSIRRRSPRATPMRRRFRRPAATRSPPRSRRRRTSISPRKITSNIWRRTPMAIAA